jgi:hypothetical protein
MTTGTIQTDLFEVHEQAARVRELDEHLRGLQDVWGAIIPSGHLSLVLVRQATEHSPPYDPARRPRRPAARFPWHRQLQRAVWPRLVVVAHKLAHHGPQVPLIHDDQVIEASALERPDEPLRDGVGNRLQLPVMATIRPDFGSSIRSTHSPGKSSSS